MTTYTVVEGYDLPLEVSAIDVYGLRGEKTARGGSVNYTLSSINAQFTLGALNDVNIGARAVDTGLRWNGGQYVHVTYALQSALDSTNSTVTGHINDSSIHFADAPVNGQPYVRKNTAWAQATPAEIGADPAGSAATVQTNLDTHTGNGSIHFADATSDGNIYGRQNANWVVVPTAVDEKVKVNATDTTTGFLEDKSVGRYSIQSLTIDQGGGNLGRAHNLVGDTSTPGNSKYYGTSSGGVRGFHDLPSGTTDEKVKVSSDDTATAFLSEKLIASASGSITFTTANPGGNETYSPLLTNDAASPGNNKLYGTNPVGVKGWYDQPGGGGGTDELVKITAADTTENYLNAKLVAANSLRFQIANPGANEQLFADLQNDSSTPGNNKLYGTSAVGTRGWYDQYASPLTTKGDVFTRDGSGDARLPVGSNDQFLKANSATTTGLEWSNVTVSKDLPIVDGGTITLPNQTVTPDFTNGDIVEYTLNGGSIQKFNLPTGVTPASGSERQLAIRVTGGTSGGSVVANAFSSYGVPWDSITDPSKDIGVDGALTNGQSSDVPIVGRQNGALAWQALGSRFPGALQALTTATFDAATLYAVDSGGIPSGVTGLDIAARTVLSDTAANFASGNPTLLKDQFGIESDNGRLKRGDGTTAWNSLKYLGEELTEVSSGTATTNLKWLDSRHHNVTLMAASTIDLTSWPTAGWANMTVNIVLSGGSITDIISTGNTLNWGTNGKPSPLVAGVYVFVKYPGSTTVYAGLAI